MVFFNIKPFSFSDILKKRFHNIRTSLSREEKKLKTAKSGSSGGEKPRWKLYEYAKFLIGTSSMEEFSSSSLSSQMKVRSYLNGSSFEPVHLDRIVKIHSPLIYVTVYLTFISSSRLPLHL